MADKLCWFCEHVHMSLAELDWSEYTPGSDFSMNCNKGHWYLDPYNETLDEFRRKLRTANTCSDFVDTER